MLATEGADGSARGARGRERPQGRADQLTTGVLGTEGADGSARGARGRERPQGRAEPRTPRALASLGIAILSACSTLGTPASPAGPLPHGGTGQFRALTVAETMLGPSPAGITLMTGGRAIDDAMPIQGNLFYAAATIAAPVDAGVVDGGATDGGATDGGATDGGAGPDASVPTDAGVSADAALDAGPTPPPGVDWARFQGRQIFRSVPGEAWGFMPGTAVLSASEPWEGGYVTDPWVVRRADGRYLLYYAAAGGIGVASAASLDGPWVREGGAAVLPTTSEGTPRRPSAVSSAGLEGASAAMVVYYELAGSIRVATSADGIALTDAGSITTVPIEARDDRDGVEVEVGAPGAITVPTPAGRSVVRLYYESRRDNGVVLVGMLGSGDGVHFDQFTLPVFQERDRQRPAPRYVDARTTVLYTWVPNGSNGAEIASITPAGVRLNAVAPTPF